MPPAKGTSVVSAVLGPEAAVLTRPNWVSSQLPVRAQGRPSHGPPEENPPICTLTTHSELMSPGNPVQDRWRPWVPSRTHLNSCKTGPCRRRGGARAAHAAAGSQQRAGRQEGAPAAPTGSHRPPRPAEARRLAPDKQLGGQAPKSFSNDSIIQDVNQEPGSRITGLTRSESTAGGSIQQPQLGHVQAGAALGRTGDAGGPVGHHAVQGSHQDVRHVVCQHLRADEDFAEFGFMGPSHAVLSSHVARTPAKANARRVTPGAVGPAAGGECPAARTHLPEAPSSCRWMMRPGG